MLKTFVSITVILCFLVLTQPNSASIGKSLVAHWTFDEGQGATIKDSASGIEGKIEGKVSWIEGKYGTALKFDDNGTGIIKVDIDPKLNFGDDFSPEEMAALSSIAGQMGAGKVVAMQKLAGSMNAVEGAGFDAKGMMGALDENGIGIGSAMSGLSEAVMVDMGAIMGSE